MFSLFNLAYVTSTVLGMGLICAIAGKVLSKTIFKDGDKQ